MALTCEKCNADVMSVAIYKGDLLCWPCIHEAKGHTNQSAYVIGDDIPGGLEIKHGICNPDGTPRKYYSKSEIRRAAYDKNWTISGETPKPNPRVVERELARAEQRAKGY